MANDKDDETDNGVPEESVSEEETQQSVSDEDGAVDDSSETEAPGSVSDSDSAVEEDVADDGDCLPQGEPGECRHR